MGKLKEKFSWVLSDSIELDPTQNIDDLKKIGPFWGSWRTWRACQTDNVVCHDQLKAQELLKREFQTKCNFYIPDSVYVSLDRPEGVNVYAGEFVHDVIRQEEIVALHLAASTSDIIILLGWDFSKLVPDNDRLQSNQKHHHRNLIRQAFVDYYQKQWVIVDHKDPIDPNLLNLDNVVIDTIDTVLSLAS
jgi:hypothetical protein